MKDKYITFVGKTTFININEFFEWMILHGISSNQRLFYAKTNEREEVNLREYWGMTTKPQLQQKLVEVSILQNKIYLCENEHVSNPYSRTNWRVFIYFREIKVTLVCQTVWVRWAVSVLNRSCMREFAEFIKEGPFFAYKIIRDCARDSGNKYSVDENSQF